MRITKSIRERLKKGFDIKIEANGKFYFFFKQEFTNGEIGEWVCDIYVDDELQETNFLSEDEVIDEIKSI